MTHKNKFTCKYAHWDVVYEAADPEIKSILDSCPVVDTSIAKVDIRREDFEVGDVTSPGGFWHADTKFDPDALHHIWTSGPCRTMFKREDGTTYCAPDAQWITYKHDVHKGPIVGKPTHRLFVRVTESKMVSGNGALIPYE